MTDETHRAAAAHAPAGPWAALDDLPDPIAVLTSRGMVIFRNAAFTARVEAQLRRPGPASSRATDDAAAYVDQCRAAFGLSGEAAAKLAAAFDAAAADHGDDDDRGDGETVRIACGPAPMQRVLEIRFQRAASQPGVFLAIHRVHAAPAPGPATALTTATAAGPDADRRSGRPVPAGPIETSAQMMFELDREGTFTAISTPLLHRLGYRREELIGHWCRLIIDEADHERTDAAFRARLRGEVVGPYDVRLQHRSGAVIPVEVRSHPLYDARGEIIGTRSVLYDVLLEADVARRLRASEARYHLLAEHSTDMISEHAPDTTYRYVSPACRRLLGYEPEELVGRRPLDFIHPDDLPLFDEARERLMQHDDPQRMTLRVRCRGGQYIWLEALAKPVLDPRTRSVTSVIASSRDVTVRKQTEQSLAREIGFRRAIEASLLAGIVTINREARLTYVNPAFCRLVGWSESELLGCTPPFPYWPQDDAPRLAAVVRRMVAGEFTPTSLEMRLRHRDGQLIDVLLHVSPLVEEDGRTIGWVGCMHDITDRKRSEAEAAQRHQRERFMFNELNHRVRNNLASLMSLIEVSRCSAMDAATFSRTIQGRIQAMATAHSLLSKNKWSPAQLEDLARAVLPAAVAGEMVLCGEPLLLPPYQATPIAMILHELGTNSMKYGALGVAGGRAALSWATEELGEGRRRVELHWTEHGGPPIDTAPTPGVGTSLIEGLVRSDLKGCVTLTYPREGPQHRLAFDVLAVPG